jgi:hypothetical protein
MIMRTVDPYLIFEFRITLQSMNKKLIKLILSLIIAISISGILHAGKKPEEQSGYEKSKDVGLKAPKGAEVLFDGTDEVGQEELGNVAQEGYGNYLEDYGKPQW